MRPVDEINATSRRRSARDSDGFTEHLRKQYDSLICDLLGAGRTEPAYQIADIAVAQGLWPDRLHRPVRLHPAEQGDAFFDPDGFWFTAYLEENSALIRDELDRVADPVAAGFASAGLAGASVHGGAWRQLMLWDRGRRFDRACAAFPVTAELVSAIPEATEYGPGFVMLSWLQPGTWIAPHCGPTNSKARTHLCVRAADGARIRVGDQVREWRAGRCLVFDDSFEHEVWHDGTEPRIVLIIDTPNPRLADAERVRRAEQAAWTDEIRTFMSGMRLSEISRDGAELTIRFAEPMLDFITSYLDTRELDLVELRNGVLRVHAEADRRTDG